MVVTKPRIKSLWKGPGVDGITQSLLSSFLVCKERFRLKVVEGLGEPDRFNHRLEYGQLWHTCEEALAAEKDWQKPLMTYAKELATRYTAEQSEVYKYYNLCKIQFPEYVKYWKKNPDVKDRTPMFQEATFRVPYFLPSGRLVWLLGKFDAVDLIGRGKKAGIYLQENKTKGDISESGMQQQLLFDLQTMFYLTALDALQNIIHEGFDERLPGDELGPIFPSGEWMGNILEWDYPIMGVRYNVIRRPLSGGKGSIRRHQPTKSNPKGEGEAEFYERLRSEYIAAEPGYWFYRWKVDILRADIDKFKKTFLNPILEHLCDWWEYIESNPNPFLEGNAIHYRTPYGLYNPMAEGKTTFLDDNLNTGSRIGLSKLTTLFPELDLE